MTFSRDAKAHIPPPPDCLSCAQCQVMKSKTGTRYACLKDKPMHPGCAWHTPRTESAMTPQRGA